MSHDVVIGAGLYSARYALCWLMIEKMMPGTVGADAFQPDTRSAT